MIDNLVKRLLNLKFKYGVMFWDYEVIDAAASRIEQLEAEVKRLEQQLKMARRLAYRPQPEYPPEIGVPHLRED